MSLKTELSYEEYAWLISEIRSKIEGNDNDGPAHKYLIFKFSFAHDLTLCFLTLKI